MVDVLPTSIESGINAVAFAIQGIVDSIATTVQNGRRLVMAPVFRSGSATIQAVVDSITPDIEPSLGPITSLIKADPDVIQSILVHLKQRAPPGATPRQTQPQAVQIDLFVAT